MELEKMTGRKYEYINIDEVDKVSNKWRIQDNLDEITVSFVEYNEKTRSRSLIRNGYHRILKDLNADALIHYQENHSEETIRAGEGLYHYIRSRGTPVKISKG